MLKQLFSAGLGAGALILASPLGALASSTAEAAAAAGGDEMAWYFWPIILFFFCFVLGVVAVLAGVGGGVLYVPLIGGFFPFHIDFVRGAGLMVALAGALAAGPGLLKRNLASLRLACRWRSSLRRSPLWAPCSACTCRRWTPTSCRSVWA